MWLNLYKLRLVYAHFRNKRYMISLTIMIFLYLHKGVCTRTTNVHDNAQRHVIKLSTMHKHVCERPNLTFTNCKLRFEPWKIGFKRTIYT